MITSEPLNHQKWRWDPAARAGHPAASPQPGRVARTRPCGVAADVIADRWRENRRWMENRLVGERHRQTAAGERRVSLYAILSKALPTVFRVAGLYGWGRRNAGDIRVTPVEFVCPRLPTAFDGYTILFLSDIHAAAIPEMIDKAVGIVGHLAPDLVLLGGDYQCSGTPSAAKTVELMAPLLAAMTPPDGMFGILGNHDRHDMVEALEGHGVTMLVNRHITVERGGKRLVVVGTDDVHCFYTKAALDAVRQAPTGFRIALIHSPEFADQTALSGFDLYLAGHTHGGQVCLPGGRPIITARDGHRALAKGRWTHHGMPGYTTTGLGSSLPAVRFNSRPELVMIRLRRG